MAKKFTPPINYTSRDIAKNHGGEVAKKLNVCLSQLSRLNIKGILQGDLLFTDDLKTINIDGEKMISFTDRYRNNFKSDRYSELDKSQVKLHERLDTVYNGFFKDEKHNKDIKEVFNQVKPYLEKFGYESDYQI